AIDLALVEDSQQLAVQRLRRGQVTAERLLDDDPRPRTVANLPHEAGLPEPGADWPERFRRGRQVVNDVSLRAVASGDLLHGLTERVQVLAMVVGAAPVIRGALEALEQRRVDRRLAELAHGFRQALAHRLVGERLRSEGEDGEVLVEESVPGQVVQRRQELAPREVAAAAEDHEQAGRSWAGRCVVAERSAHGSAP